MVTDAKTRAARTDGRRQLCPGTLTTCSFGETEIGSGEKCCSDCFGRASRSRNQGAESTLAMISVLQQSVAWTPHRDEGPWADPIAAPVIPEVADPAG